MPVIQLTAARTPALPFSRASAAGPEDGRLGRQRKPWENRLPAVAGETPALPFCRASVAGPEDGRLGRQRNRGRTAFPQSQARRLRSPSPAHRLPDRRTAVSAVNGIVGEPPSRSRRRGRLRSCITGILPVIVLSPPDAGITGKDACDTAYRGEDACGPVVVGAVHSTQYSLHGTRNAVQPAEALQWFVWVR